MKRIALTLIALLSWAPLAGMSVAQAFKKLQEKRPIKQASDSEHLAESIRHELIARAESFRAEFLRLEQLESFTQKAITRAASSGDLLKECALRTELSSYTSKKRHLEDDFYREIGLANTAYLVNSGIEMDPSKRTGEQWFNQLAFDDIIMLAKGIGYKSAETKQLKKEHFDQIVL